MHTGSQGIPLLISCFRNLSYDNCQGLNSYFFNIEHKFSFEYKNRILNVFVCMTVCLNIYLRAFLIHSEALLKMSPNPCSFSVKMKKYISSSSEIYLYSCTVVLHKASQEEQ